MSYSAGPRGVHSGTETIRRYSAKVQLFAGVCVDGQKAIPKFSLSHLGPGHCIFCKPCERVEGPVDGAIWLHVGDWVDPHYVIFPDGLPGPGGDTDYVDRKPNKERGEV